ncbi:MAG: hypothetical protein ACRCY8_02990 [Dermatophilaceae bacterium]
MINLAMVGGIMLAVAQALAMVWHMHPRQWDESDVSIDVSEVVIDRG